MIAYEELEEYFEQLKNIDHIAPIYVTVNRNTIENIVYGTVMVMAVDSRGVIHGYTHKEDIPAVKLIPNEYFQMVEDEKRREIEFGEYKARFDNFEEALSKQYFKMKDVLKALGFQKIFNAHLIG